MQEWQKQLVHTVTSVETVAERFGVDPEPLLETVARYPFRVTSHYLDLIEAPGDPIWRQCMPDSAELLEDDRLCSDPLAEARHSPVPGVVHRHLDRVLLLVAGGCPTLCRFCFRKGRLDSDALELSSSRFDDAIAYLEARPGIREVILTGGEPLLLEDDRISEILTALRRIDHIDILRIHTRAPVVLPARITEKLVSLLLGASPLYLMIHVNHPLELTAEFADACSRLADAGIVLGSQTVLMRGVNDVQETLEALMRGLLRLRVRPYYLHHPDLTAGTGHFRTTLEHGRRLIDHLQDRLPGLAVPHYVVDLPGGRGKVPVARDCVESLGSTTILRAPNGERVEVPND